MSKKLIIFLALLLCGVPNIVSLPFDFAQGNEFLELSNYAFAQSVDTAWVRRYNGPADSNDFAQAIALDGSGNVYLTGYSYGSGTSSDYATIKYFSNGDTAWVRRYNGPLNFWDFAFAIAVDDSGNVYVTGTSGTIKYSTNGSQLWVNPLSGEDIAVNDSGNVYVTGSSYSSATSYDYATIKYYPNGDTVWIRRYNGPGNGEDGANAIAVDDSGNLYVTGHSRGINTVVDYATIKYSPNGDTAWVRRYNGPGNWDDRANTIAVDDSGNVYVTGYSFGSGTGDDYATIKYYPNGDTAWVRRYNGPGNDNDWAYAIAVDDSGNVFVTGGSEGNFTTIKYYPSGDTAWVRRYTEGYNDAYAIAVDGSGNVYVTGRSRLGDLTGYDYATIKYYPNGNTAWVRRYNGSLNGEDEAYAVTADYSGNVYITGRTDGSGSNGGDYATIKYVQFLRGDANKDSKVTVADVVYLVSYLFKGGPLPNPILQVGDSNCDGKVTIADVVFLVAYLFKGGPQPCI